MEQRINDEFIEKQIIKRFTTNQEYLNKLVTANINPAIFSGGVVHKIYEFSREHFNEYQSIPTTDIIKNSLNDKS